MDSRELIDNLDGIVNSLPKQLPASEQLIDDTEKTLKEIDQSKNQCKIIYIHNSISVVMFDIIILRLFSG